jgi:hypothetical protein
MLATRLRSHRERGFVIMHQKLQGEKKTKQFDPLSDLAIDLAES